MISSVSDGLTELQNFAAIASGADDAVWLGIVQAYAAQGYTAIDVRIGWEQNGTWQPWAVTSAATAQGYIAAFQHISTLLHAVAGMSVNVIWNPSTLDSSAVPTAASYPGNAYVDTIGVDIYDTVFPLSLYDWTTHTTASSLAQWEANPANLQHYWSYPDATAAHPTGSGAGFGLADAMQMAKADGKPLALPETGAGGATTSPPDDSVFPAYLASTLLAAGGPAIAFADLWDSGAYTFSDGSKPDEAAAWASFVKALDQYDPGPSDSAGSTVVVHGATVNLAAQVAGLIRPGRPGDTETITAVKVVRGKVTLGAGGAITYTAPARGTDTLTYTVTDQLGNTATFTDAITIDPGPSASPGTSSVAAGATAALGPALAALVTPGLAGATDSITSVKAAKGVATLGAGGAVTYVAPRAAGTDTLTYKVTDQYGATTTAVFTITVTGSAASVSGTTSFAGTVPAGAQNRVGVALVTAVGTTVATTLTSNGQYAFGAVAAGRYQLRFTPPAGEVLAPGGSVDVSTGLTAAFTLTAGASYVAPAAAFVQAARIGGSVLGGGAGLPGVTVTLLDAGNVIATTMTGSGGAFVFTGLEAGSYQVKYAPVTGEALLSGPAAAGTGLTPAMNVVAGQAVSLAAETFGITAAVAEGAVHHFGSADPIWGTGQSGVGVALVNAAGVTVKTTTALGAAGWFQFNGVAPGTYHYVFTLPAGEAFMPGGQVNAATGASASFTLAPGATFWAPLVAVQSSSNTFALDGAGAIALRGDGNYVVSGTASGGKLVLGAGNDTVTLTGGGNTISDGPGISFITTGASVGNRFVLDPAGQGIAVISGFNSGDVLDLSRVLAGFAGASLATLGQFVTAASAGGNTSLFATPAGGGAASAFVTLDGVTATVASLVSGHSIKLS